MPKMKTHKGTAKRIKQRKSGSLKRGGTPQDHFLAKMSSKRKRKMRKGGGVSEAYTRRIKRLLTTG